MLNTRKDQVAIGALGALGGLVDLASRQFATRSTRRTDLVGLGVVRMASRACVAVVTHDVNLWKAEKFCRLWRAEWSGVERGHGLVGDTTGSCTSMCHSGKQFPINKPSFRPNLFERLRKDDASSQNRCQESCYWYCKRKTKRNRSRDQHRQLTERNCWV